MSYTKSLRNVLKDKNTALFNRLVPIEEAAKSVLTYTASMFPFYTPHDFRHSQNVEENLNWIVRDEIKKTINSHEIFFLIVSSWMHDWGMVGKKDEDPEDVRNKHHVRTEEYFEKLYDKIKVDRQEARIIGKIYRGHRREDLHGDAYKDSFIGSNIPIRVAFISSLLRLADECDITANRTPEIIFYTLTPEGASEEEFQKHLSIGGIGSPDAAQHKIVISAVAYSPQGVEVIYGVEKKIQQALDSVKTILAIQGIVIDIVETQIDTRGFINQPIAFELDRKSIVDLLIGRALYSREDVAIRELLQNSLDTCRLRKILYPDYEPSILIEFDKDHLTFKDNGLGMNFENAYEHFSKKGSSFYVSKYLTSMLKGKQFDPISKFGIGVLSIFLIADKMTLQTKKENCSPCKFSINNLTEGWRYEEGAREESGTEITIFLNDTGKNLDILKSLNHYAKNVDIPISINDLKTGEQQTFQQKWDCDIPEVIEILRDEKEERFLKKDSILKFVFDSPDHELIFYIFDELRWTHLSRQFLEIFKLHFGV